ncbi:DUF397 domain-containing protein [Streptomyces phaeochromogenes]|uniref:DUF397 domain-containing protein n=1 Tax=Streptomyces phaeochromogenes TaxID=1923 RepID=UPI00371AD4AC
MLRTDGVWVKSSHSEEGACVEVSARQGLRVRDSKDPHISGLTFDVTAWACFVAALHAQEIIPANLMPTVG